MKYIILKTGKGWRIEEQVSGRLYMCKLNYYQALLICSALNHKSQSPFTELVNYKIIKQNSYYISKEGHFLRNSSNDFYKFAEYEDALKELILMIKE